jgi:hypothetical protein
VAVTDASSREVPMFAGRVIARVATEVAIPLVCHRGGDARVSEGMALALPTRLIRGTAPGCGRGVAGGAGTRRPRWRT